MIENVGALMFDLLKHPVAELRDSTIDFYMTGSRLFGGARIDSDWDFFVHDTDETRFWLLQHGFVEEGMNHRINSYPDDPNIASVYFKGNVQVQVVRDAQLKNMAQLLLLSLPIPAGFRTAPKHLRRVWWSWAFRTVEYPIG